MSSKSLGEIFESLPILKKAAWLLSIQEEIQELIPNNYKIKCSIKDNELVLLADSAAFARRLSLYLPNIQPILDKYNLVMPAIIIIPNKKYIFLYIYL
jgi:hypothetical protein